MGAADVIPCRLPSDTPATRPDSATSFARGASPPAANSPDTRGPRPIAKTRFAPPGCSTQRIRWSTLHPPTAASLRGAQDGRSLPSSRCPLPSIPNTPGGTGGGVSGRTIPPRSKIRILFSAGAKSPRLPGSNPAQSWERSSKPCSVRKCVGSSEAAAALLLGSRRRRNEPQSRQVHKAIHRKTSQFNAETQRRRGAEPSHEYLNGIQEIAMSLRLYASALNLRCLCDLCAFAVFFAEFNTRQRHARI